MIMGISARRFRVWLVSLGAIVLIYIIYTLIGGTPRIDFREGVQFTESIADPNGGIGKIAGVGIRRAEVARYVTRNKETKEIERVFGFEKLLYEQDEQWEIEKPYLDIFDPNFECHITADRGSVRVEDAAGGPSPEDGQFTGNVVIQIVPKKAGDIKESFIYLDDVTLVSRESYFSTAGPVKFDSENVQMLARGLEGVYISDLSRLEFLRIVHLESLKMKAAKAALFSPAKTQPDRVPRTTIGTDPSPAANRSAAGQKTGQYYRCLFSKNVVIDAPDQLAVAHDAISINNIFWAQTADRKAGKSDANGVDSAKTPPLPVTEPNAAQPPVDIVLRCANGILVTPMDSSRSIEDFPLADPQPAQTAAGLPDRAGRNLLVAETIDHDASSGDTVAAGPIELVFDVNDPTGRDTNAPPVPVKVTAKKAARFLPASNQVIFEGGSVCEMVSSDPNGTQQHTLAAPTITVDLATPGAASSDDVAADVRHLSADGGSVSLSSIRKVDEKVLSGVELKCRRFDFDANEQMFLATGPGEIKVDNSSAVEPNQPSQKFSFRRRCYALVQNFQTLQYYLDTNRFVADAGPDAILDIGYVPIIDSNYGEAVKVGAGHIEAIFNETAEGGLELSTLSATGGITYDDGDKDFEGDRMFYDAEKSLVTVLGSPGRPCSFKGAPVDAIHWNLKTDGVKFKITAPAALPPPPPHCPSNDTLVRLVAAVSPYAFAASI
ncbi:MAG: hypothetical protein ACYS9T_09650 [Planctomycetota bacterium]|jgi:hypothetical protein